jgi:hypothetical protein
VPPQLLHLAANREERKFVDKPPTGGPPDDRAVGSDPDATVTHGLTALVSHFGVGAKAAAFAMCPWSAVDERDKNRFPDGGFFYRTTIKDSGTMSELLLSGRDMKK